MNHKNSSSNNWLEEKRRLELKLEELSRIYNISLDLIRKATTQEELLDAILDEYIRRFDEIPGIDLMAPDGENVSFREREKIKSLLKFATQAVLLKEKANIYQELENKHKQLLALSEDLKNANEKLKHLNSYYLNMLSFVSHELRSPLSSILGFAELLEEKFLGDLNKEQRNTVKVIIKIANNLIDMIKNYLGVAKIETGEMKIKRAFVHVLEDAIHPVIAEMREQFARKQMKAVLNNLTSSPDITLWGDKELLKIVFTNIFSNAINYGHAGTEIQCTIRENDKGYEFNIFNYGSGVAPDQLQKIFQRFTQIHHPDSETSGGAGLGLFISMWIIEQHAGKIWAESEKNKWFRLSFQLPKGCEFISQHKEPCCSDEFSKETLKDVIET